MKFVIYKQFDINIAFDKNVDSFSKLLIKYNKIKNNYKTSISNMNIELFILFILLFLLLKQYIFK